MSKKFISQILTKNLERSDNKMLIEGIRNGNLSEGEIVNYLGNHNNLALDDDDIYIVNKEVFLLLNDILNNVKSYNGNVPKGSSVSSKVKNKLFKLLEDHNLGLDEGIIALKDGETFERSIERLNVVNNTIGNVKMLNKMSVSRYKIDVKGKDEPYYEIKIVWVFNKNAIEGLVLKNLVVGYTIIKVDRYKISYNLLLKLSNLR